MKTGELTHQDIGQIDFYRRIFDDKIKPKEDNPTIGLVLCSSKDENVVKYSILSDNKNLYASKYLEYLPTEEELKRELELERQEIERKLLEDSENKTLEEPQE